MHSYSFRSGQAQSGVAMVEFAIALPLLLLLLLAIGEFGRMLYHYNNLLQANRDAVRYLAGEAWNTTLGRVDIDSALETRTKNVAVYGVPAVLSGKEVVPGLTTGDVTLGPVAVGSNHVQVRISYMFRPVIGNALPGLIGGAMPLSFPLVVTTVMRAL